MADRGELGIAALALVAAGFVLAAPVLGRAGYAGAADGAMAIAAACGFASFVLAGATTVRAARAKPRSERAAEDAR